MTISVHHVIYFLSSKIPPPPRSTLFPYTTLFRSLGGEAEMQVDRAEQACLDGLVGIADHRLERRDDVADHVFRRIDRKSTRLNSSHVEISYAVFCLKKKKIKT